MQDTPPQTQEPVATGIHAISLSRANVADFLQGQRQQEQALRAPLTLKRTLVREYALAMIAANGAEPKLRPGMLDKLMRFCAEAAAEAIIAMIPADWDGQRKTRPKHLLDNAMIAGAKAAEAVVPGIVANIRRATHRQPELPFEMKLDRDTKRRVVLEAWLETTELKLVAPTKDGEQWLCCGTSVKIDDPIQAKAAMAQNLATYGDTAIQAARVYAETNDIPFPKILQSE